jgi:hypothetical protein
VLYDTSFPFQSPIVREKAAYCCDAAQAEEQLATNVSAGEPVVKVVLVIAAGGK